MKLHTVLPFATTTTNAQAATYLLSVCLFSISFLVFLNSSVSFLITDLIGREDGVGDLVGTLGFADELVALIACPVWGILSDRLGVRIVCVLGYAIVALALLLSVQASNVYPQLLLARMLFSVGGAATATMVTAMLPTMTGGVTATSNGSTPMLADTEDRDSGGADSVDSETTVTPENHVRKPASKSEGAASSPPRLAGLVGLFTGCGALVALLLFLPLPARFSHLDGVTQAQAVADSFYVVGSIALLVSVSCFLGLRGLQGEEHKSWRVLLGKKTTSASGEKLFLPYWKLLFDSMVLGFNDANIGLGYLGGFVARASSVGISLFVPLYINQYFIRNGFCRGSPNDPSPELKKECRAAYVLAAELTGISQLVALLCAPLFGYLSDRYRRFNVPLLVASLLGIIGYIGFAKLVSPEPQNIDGRGGTSVVFLLVACIGVSQIGAIVCSLGLLGRGVLGEDVGYFSSSQLQVASSTPSSSPPSSPLPSSSSSSSPSPSSAASDDGETSLLLVTQSVSAASASRSHLKGSIAGVYSLSGGAAILLLTKVGGYLFDTLSTGAPFYMMAIFNATLLVIGIGAGSYREISNRVNSFND